MSFTDFDYVILSNIFSYLDPKTGLPSDKSFKIIKKFPKCARKEFIDGLHPYYLYLWKLRNHYNGWLNHTNNLIFNAISKKLPNDYIIYLIEKVHFNPTNYDLEPIFKTENFELMHYYYKLGLMTGISSEVAHFFTKKNRLDIIDWLFCHFEKHMMYYKNSLIISSIKYNHLEISDYLHNNKKAKVANGYELIYSTWISSIEWHLEKGLINKDTIEWLWKHGYRWTAKDVDRIGNEEMRRFL
jgi:hypothetical protein